MEQPQVDVTVIGAGQWCRLPCPSGQHNNAWQRMLKAVLQS